MSTQLPKCIFCSLSLTQVASRLPCGHAMCWACNHDTPKHKQICPQCSPGRYSAEARRVIGPRKEEMNKPKMAYNKDGNHTSSGAAVTPSMKSGAHADILRKDRDKTGRSGPRVQAVSVYHQSMNLQAKKPPIRRAFSNDNSEPSREEKPVVPPALPLSPRPATLEQKVFSGSTKKHLCWMKDAKYGVEALAFLPNGNIIVILNDTKTNIVKVFDAKGNQTQPFKVDRFLDPMAVASHHGNTSKVVISDRFRGSGTITVFTLSHNPERWISQSFPCNSHPRALAFANDKEIIMGTGLGKALIRISVANGATLSKKKVDHFCSNLAVDSVGRIAVSDYDDKKIVLYDHNLNMLSSFPEDLYMNTTHLGEVRGIANEADNSFLVADQTKMCVVRYDPKEDDVRLVQKTTTKPICVAVYEGAFMAIGTDKNVLLFQATG